MSIISSLSPSRMTEEARIRRQKLDALRAAGHNPYPSDVQRTATCADAHQLFEANAIEGKSVTLAGRLFTVRVHGALLFSDLVDESGKLQLVLKEDDLLAEQFVMFRDLIDPGDFVEATGTLFLTKRGERSLKVASWRILAKALLPLPEKWHGLKDIEQRFRHRELDLLSNPEVKQRFLVRSKLVSSLRRFLDDRGFLEVETPVLQSIPGGANARPFTTHHNALDVDLYLRIAPELYLKRLIVGGFEKVYEVGKSFRNEGIDYAHNPEFTMFELYWAYAQKEQFISFLEELLATLVTESMGQLQVAYQGGTLDFSGPWKRVTFREAIIDACGIDIDTLTTREEVIQAARAQKLSIDFGDCVGLGECFDALYKKTARAQMTSPVWVMDYPADLKPLAKRTASDPSKSCSVQLVIHGAEIINAYYYELNDPIDQFERFAEQQSLREQGSDEAQWMDQEFLTALEHGMPPTSGVGIGIDRLVAFLTDSPTLKEVILFPTLRPVVNEPEAPPESA